MLEKPCTQCERSLFPFIYSGNAERYTGHPGSCGSGTPWRREGEGGVTMGLARILLLTKLPFCHKSSRKGGHPPFEPPRGTTQTRGH